ncbi:MAG TPA: class II aldolase/adducin family protein [Dehalococcoidia bacterium]|nr:class II aldolase/adducin family protein [Dehalococcoidia bacterium]
MSFEDVKYQVAVANRVLAETGLATGVLAANGHASMRVPEAPDRFVVKGRGYKIDALARMRPEDMVVCDLEGNLIEGPPGATQCFEVKMHSYIYRTYADVHSVVHVHPRFVVLMSVLGLPLVPMCQEGLQIVRRPLPVYPHVKTIQSDEEGMEVAALLDDRRAVILQGHGATTAGASLEEATLKMLQLEEQARMNWYAVCAAGPLHPSISEEQVREMSERTPLRELPHFREVMRAAQPRIGGVWAHYADLAAAGI